MDASGKMVAWQNHFVSYGEDDDASGQAVRRSADARRNGRTEFPQPLRPELRAAHFGAAARRSAPVRCALRAATRSRSSSRASSTNWRTLRARIRCSSGCDLLLAGQRRLRAALRADSAAAWRSTPTRMRGVLNWWPRSRAGARRRCPRAPRWASASTSAISGYFAEVAEVTVSGNKKVKVNKVWVAADIGSQIINPRPGENMAQGAIIDGMGEMMEQEITVDNGRVVQTNFDTHPLCGSAAAPPDIEVH